jgi:hypothetical protein
LTSAPRLTDKFSVDPAPRLALDDVVPKDTHPLDRQRRIERPVVVLTAPSARSAR